MFSSKCLVQFFQTATVPRKALFFQPLTKRNEGSGDENVIWSNCCINADFLLISLLLKVVFSNVTEKKYGLENRSARESVNKIFQASTANLVALINMSRRVRLVILLGAGRG